MALFNPFSNYDDTAYRPYRQRMQREKSRGRRLCRLCDEPIKKGQTCYTMRVRGHTWTRGIHIHTSHIKPFNPKNCTHKMECVTGKYQCDLQICNLNRRSKK